MGDHAGCGRMWQIGRSVNSVPAASPPVIPLAAERDRAWGRESASGSRWWDWARVAALPR